MKISHIKDKLEVILTQNERASFRLPADKVDVTKSYSVKYMYCVILTNSRPWTLIVFLLPLYRHVLSTFY